MIISVMQSPQPMQLFSIVAALSVLIYLHVHG